MINVRNMRKNVNKNEIKRIKIHKKGEEKGKISAE